VKRSEWLPGLDATVEITPLLNAAAAADRRFGMVKRIEQSRRHGHHDPRWSTPVHAVSASPLPLDAREEPSSTPPTLTLVGGTDLAPKLLDPIATPST
jgi:hypothetical protein